MAITDDEKQQALVYIRSIGKEFEKVADEELLTGITILSPMVAKKKYREMYIVAVALLVCHKLKMNGNGDTSMGTIADASHVGSYSEGGVSVSFTNWMGGSALQNDAELALTVYGLQFLNLRKMYVPSITIAGSRL